MPTHHTCTTCSAQDVPLRMTTAEASQYVGVAQSTLRTWRHNRIGPASFTLGGKVIYDRTDLDDWLAAEKAKSVRGGAAR
ncbi:helix-turn-helix domain-containing protein [Mycolicibacterium fortuitum]|uniref:helix-turn-helix domain-containing protein n=1 Tax=Mycolicibacterium fortuitum TaxID=1766 RepID=UPI001CE076A9|nr:helix-turn-helix domain-containing protein [Mycolicibacterium fortuitum]